MSAQVLGLIVGGFIPAFLFGFTNIAAKLGSQNGVSVGLYTIIAGIGVIIAGVCLFFLQPALAPMTQRTMWFALTYGILWGIGSGCIMLALTFYKVPLSSIVPIFNMNTLIAVGILLIFFGESQQVHVLQLLVGAIFVVIGGTLVALS